MASPEKRLKKLGLAHVPTLRELAEQGLAKVIAETAKGAPTHYRPTKKGDRLLTHVMDANAAVLRTINAEYQQARVTEQLAREKADDLMALLNHASKGI